MREAQERKKKVGYEVKTIGGDGGGKGTNLTQNNTVHLRKTQEEEMKERRKEKENKY